MFNVELIWKTHNMIRVIEYCGRKCYASKPSESLADAYQWVENIVNSGHESVIEHGSIILYVEKPDRFDDMMILSRELLEMQRVSMINIAEGPFGYLIGGNIRAIKDMYRGAEFFCYFLKELENILYLNLPRCLFVDLIDSGVLNNNFIMDKQYIEEEVKDLGVPNKTQISEWLSIVQISGIEDDIFTNSYRAFSKFIRETCEKYSVHPSTLKDMLTITYVWNATRTATHQLVRHRLNCSYSQMSQRYIKFTGNKFNYLLPNTLREKKATSFCLDLPNGSTVDLTVDQFIELSGAMYNALLQGSKAEDARSVLPNCMLSEIAITQTFGALEHQFEIRGSEHAQAEIRENTVDLYNYFSKNVLSSETVDVITPFVESTSPKGPILVKVPNYYEDPSNESTDSKNDD